MTTATTAGSSVRQLFAAFAAASLVAVIALGAVLMWRINSEANARGLAEARRAATLVGRTAIAPLLGDRVVSGSLDPQELRLLQRSVSGAIAQREVLRLRVRTLSGAVVFSDDNSGFGGQIDDEVLDAAKGEIVAHLTHLNSDTNDSGAGGVQVVEVYQPLVASGVGTRIGVLELYLPYAPIATDINDGVRTLTWTLGAGLVVLWGVLLALAATTTRRLRQQASENAFQANHDTLTSLPNRRMFINEAAAALGANAAEFNVAIAMLDIDRFKEVNDALGHASGDLLLELLGYRLRAQLRPGDTVARIGGDEFGLILRNLNGADEAVTILRGLRSSISEEIDVSGLPLRVEASGGFALAPADGSDAQQLLRAADVAMYVAKQKHLALARYDAALSGHDARSLSLVAELQHAIEDDQLVLHYQPKADLRTGRVCSVEALVRWPHPVRGLLYPDAFLPVAEQTELIEPLTRLVLRHAVRDLPGFDPSGMLAVAVNVSARSLIRDEFAGEVLALLEQSDTPPGRLIVEITETALLTDPERAGRTLRELTAAGVSISIDDFGAGQTSLAYLAALPVNEVKIDKVFVLDMVENPRNAAIVRSVIQLGHSLGFTVTAEGVETSDAFDALSVAGCDMVQGYLLSRPVPAALLPSRITDVDSRTEAKGHTLAAR